MTSHEEFYTQSPGSRTVSSSDYHAKCAGCAEKDQQIARLKDAAKGIGMVSEMADMAEVAVLVVGLHAEIDRLTARVETSVGVDVWQMTVQEFERTIAGLTAEREAYKKEHHTAYEAATQMEAQVSALQAKLEAAERERDEVYQGWKEMSELAASNFEELTAADEDVRALAGAMQKASEFLDEDDIRLPITGREIAAKSTLDSALARHSVRTIVEGA